jgi:hypothetical protein
MGNRRYPAAGLGATVGVVAIVAGVMIATGSGQRPAPSLPLDRLSAAGAPIAIELPMDRRALVRMERTDSSIRIIAQHGQRSFYRVAGQSDCYAVGPTVPTEYRLGQIGCAANFPSPARPVLDFSIFAGPRSELRMTRGEGFAADGIASVALEDAAGAVLAESQVDKNTYAFADPPKAAVARLVALDRDGHPVFTRPYALASP